MCCHGSVATSPGKGCRTKPRAQPSARRPPYEAMLWIQSLDPTRARGQSWLFWVVAGIGISLPALGVVLYVFKRWEELVSYVLEPKLIWVQVYIHVMWAKRHQTERCRVTHNWLLRIYWLLLKTDEEMVGALKAREYGSHGCTVSSHWFCWFEHYTK